jgi:putative nucleotidyltransferase with HDIG domain
MHSLDFYIKQIKTLPPGPRILSRLLIMLRQPDLDSDEVVRLITFDPALTVKVLQRCNSALYGLTRPVYDLEEAVMRLGFNLVYRLVATVVGEAALGTAQGGYGIGTGELWQHSAATAVAAKVIAGMNPGDENLLFTAALLHDIGKLILSESLEGKYELVLRETEQSGYSLLEAEKTILGVDHAELGGRILEDWNFPESLVRAVRFHHQPLLATPYEHLASSIYTANMIAHLAGHGHGHQAFAVRADRAPAEFLGIGSRDVENLILETELALTETKLFSRATL